MVKIVKIQKKIMAAFAGLFVLLNCFPAPAVQAEPAETSLLESPEEEDPAVPVSREAPMFHAWVELFPQGYLVRGSFTEFLPDTALIKPCYSLDGETWESCNLSWNLALMGTENEEELAKLQNQTCVCYNEEPLRSYLGETLERFYLKLHITREDGTTYDTQTAVIERGGPRPVPEGVTLTTRFAGSLRVFERPYIYGRYQITVKENAGAEDVSALLPDTLPVEVQLHQGINGLAKAIVDCPVAWKPLSLPPLTAGESITISDAVEELSVPEGTLLHTPLGIFRLDTPLALDPSESEVRLVLNPVREGGKPAGVLRINRDGLEMAFTWKPSGASAIRAYVIREGDSGWTELPGLPLLDAVNAYQSASNSDYTLILGNDSEILQAYFAEKDAGTEPAPFYIGLKIEGGVYHGQQLILPWPDTYDIIPGLPAISGSGGNEGNAGAGNQKNSTPEGQRPNLPASQEATPETAPGRLDSSGQFPTVTQTAPEEKAKETAPESLSGDTAVPETTFPDSEIPRALLSPDREERTNPTEKPDRNAENSPYGFYIFAAMIAVISAAGIYGASPGRRQKLFRIFRI